MMPTALPWRTTRRGWEGCAQGLLNRALDANDKAELVDTQSSALFSSVAKFTGDDGHHPLPGLLRVP